MTSALPPKGDLSEAAKFVTMGQKADLDGSFSTCPVSTPKET
jgi:hypothetical protein